MRNRKLEGLVEPLLQWFEGHARILPWREEPTPYRVWISEIMLQQTRVEAVKPYFERFVEALPDVEALAACPEDELMKLWEGLGYYNRARNLKAAAHQIISEYGGRIPDRYEELLKLKGIGHYTAGAIASIAYGQAEPAVDGNVLRVIARVTADESDIMQQSVRTRMDERLRALMRRSEVRPDLFNQALMELGAIVCLPNGRPHCGECPWEGSCEAKKLGGIDRIPVKSRPKARRIEERTVLVIRDGLRVAIRKRPKKGLLAGLYEPVNVPGHLGPEEAADYVSGLGLVPLRVTGLPDAKHIFSHIEWHMKGFAVRVEDIELSLRAAEARTADALIFVERQEAAERYAIPAAFSAYTAYL